MNSISQALGPHAALPRLLQESPAEKSDEPTPASRPAQGGLQGAFVAVGSGGLGKALYRDAESVGDDDYDDDDNDVFEDAREAPDDAAWSRSELGGIARHDKREERYDAALVNPVPLSLDAAEGRHAVAGPSDEPAHFAVDDEAAQERLANEDRLQQQDLSLWQRLKNWWQSPGMLGGEADAAQQRLAQESRLQQQDAGVHPISAEQSRDVLPVQIHRAGLSSPANEGAPGGPPVQEPGFLGRISNVVVGAATQVKAGVGALLDGTLSLQKAQAPAVPQKKAAQEENLERIIELKSKIRDELGKLNVHIKNQTGKEYVDFQGDLSSVQMGVWDTVFKVRHTAAGLLTVAAPALRNLAIAASVPLVAGAAASMLGMSRLGTLAGSLAAAALGLKELLSLGKKLNDATTQSMIAEIETKLEPVYAELRLIESEEKTRAHTEDLIRLAAKPRSQKIHTLRQRISKIDEALQAAGPEKADAPREVARPLRHRVMVSDGSQRAELLDPVGGIRQRLGRFFTRVADFFFARWSAANREHAYVNALPNKQTFDDLSMAGDGTQINALEVIAERRLAPSQQEIKGLQLRRHLKQGENLVRMLRAAEPNFGVAVFKDRQGGVRAVAASLSTARMMAWYLDALADLPEEERGDPSLSPKVTRGADGVLTVLDPGRKLASFLMGVPTAYAGAMLKQKGIRIDDHSPGMPGAMSGIRFSMEFDKDRPVLKLSFVPKSSNQVFKTVDHYKQLVQLSVELRAAGAAKDAAQEDIAGLPREKLQKLCDDLGGKLKRLEALEDVDMAQLQALRNWHDPQSAVERERLAQH